MRTKHLIIAIIGLTANIYTINGAHAECAMVALAPGQTCTSVGGKMCSDGTCRYCCTSDGDTPPAFCSGTSTTSQTSFSDNTGSGYIPHTTYSKSCTCPELQL